MPFPTSIQPTLGELAAVAPSATTAAAIAADLESLRSMLPGTFAGPRAKLLTASQFVTAQAERIAELEALLARENRS